jgi:hypothetical protein
MVVLMADVKKRIFEHALALDEWSVSENDFWRGISNFLLQIQPSPPKVVE